MRKFAKTLAVVGVLTPAGVNALGVGDIKIHSALNQRLLAEIPLMVSPGEDISQIRVGLAPAEAFMRAGLERPYYLSNLHFKPLHKADGTVVIQVTSNDAIREPFLDFLLEVDWPQGRILREFTVLLDPPATFADEVAVAQNVPGATPQSIAHSRSVSNVSAGNEWGVAYGPVKRNESLWKIAERLKQDPSISTEQMVMALYRENPDAFLKGNVNNLKAGVTLKIPSAEKISRLSPSQARRELEDQYQTWLASRAPQQAAQKVQPQLKLAPPDEKELARQQVEMSIVEGPDGANPQTQEEIADLRAENEALRARLEALETKMTALLEVKNAQLAALQNKPPATESIAENTTDQAPPPAATKPAVKETGSSMSQGREETAESSSQISAVTKRPVTKPSVRAAQPKAHDSKPQANKVTDDKGGDSSASMGLFDQPLYLGLGAGGMVLLGVAGLMIWRRRREAEIQADSLLAEMDDTEADFSSPSSASEPMTSSITSTAGVEVAESSFLSEFTPSDFDILESENDAVDPIAEADVYLAYGRYQQAEELIKQALEEDPERPELRLKLLEIYYANDAASEFESYAQELLVAGADNDPEFWSKVIEMGKDLCPQSSLFVSSSEGTGTSEPEPTTLSGQPIDAFDNLELDTGPFDVPEESDVEEESLQTDQVEVPESDETGDENLDAQISEQEPLAEAGKDDDDGFSLDFDLNDLDLGSQEDETQLSEDDKSGLENSDNTIEFPSFGGETAATREDVLKEDPAIGDMPVDDAGIPGSAEATTEKDEVVKEEFDLTDMNEMDTKLDLARAYIDMEDVDAARDILDEILDRGNEQQKQEAQTLLDKLRLAS